MKREYALVVILALFSAGAALWSASPQYGSVVNPAGANYGWDAASATWRAIAVDEDGNQASSGATGAATDPVYTVATGAAKVGQPVFYRTAIATSAGTLFSTVVGTISQTSEYIITFDQSCYMGPATTTVAAITASGTIVAEGSQMSFKPGEAIDFGIVGNGEIASFSVMRWPLR